ncbi:MAG: S1/P1 nuclease [Parvibaculum sp.]|uniref:S1/P1 nuclease n=1 Tax=Parvibaculum sp. TaxID=2024848 RepID=UPI00284C5B1E|nr:S1/P1 nuclease [Parvibaculum sp.]MDR3499931.1 S1/P1 nuclease [Parvibaculum sp.]
MRRLIAIAAIAAAIMPSTAWAWGSEGHEVIALIAASELTPAARAKVGELLGGDVAGAMADASTWADRIRRVRPETAPWHYVDIEIASAGYDPARDCPNDACVVAQIQKDAVIIGDKSLAQPVRAEALRFLIHFVGDVHQPLHASNNNDRGGNEVRVVIDGARKNLHAVWDTNVVEALGNDPATVAAILERQITPEEKRQWSRGSVVDWANQSFQIAKNKIYATLPGKGGTDAPIILPSDYAAREANITSIQLERAGVRLAMLLNKVLGAYRR